MLFDFATLELKNRGELYYTLYTKIKEAAECGVIKKGEKLPSVREAAAQLGVSRTTVENAYTRLCIEGIAESRAQRGYFITGRKNDIKRDFVKPDILPYDVKYDFSSRSIDTAAADTELWKRILRSVLWDSTLLTSYGEKQGELKLREVLSDYSYKARGVKANAQNIVIGAGIGPLLNILCGLLGREIRVGIENNFIEAQSIFADYGIKTVVLESDANGATLESIEKNKIDILFLLPSSLSKISVSALNNRRNEYIEWAEKTENRYIIEDDYNGELRYTARTVTSFQGKFPHKTIYIGSFSKLLLPSVRIAYMVLPYFLAERLRTREVGYNQTCGKIEQLALAEYILRGALEKQLRRLRRIYYNKSQILCRELKNEIPDCEIELYESSLMVELQTYTDIGSKDICNSALKNGLKLIETQKNGAVRLGFAGISESEIPYAVKNLKICLEQLKKQQFPNKKMIFMVEKDRNL